MCRFCETTPPQTLVCVQRSDDCAEPPEIIDEILCDEDVGPQHLYGIIGIHAHFHLAWIDWFGVAPVLNVVECDDAGCEKVPQTILINYCPLCNRNLMEVK